MLIVCARSLVVVIYILPPFFIQKAFLRSQTAVFRQLFVCGIAMSTLRVLLLESGLFI